MPARFWKWRMQGGALTLAEQVVEAGGGDLVLATDMVNIPALLGLAHRTLDAPVVMYCHENQLTYPLPAGEKRDLTYPMINWLSMVAADRVLFNSVFHMRDWFDALPDLLKHFPDHTHLHRIPKVRDKTSVLPVGCELSTLPMGPSDAHRGSGPPTILWNQRWEYDKDPGTFFRALDALVQEDVEFRVALAGSNVRQMPQEFEAARQRLGARVVHYGRADRTTYRRLLSRSDVVVSTAIHEFFGVAVVEAVYCGCFPILPRRLAYPEVVPESLHGLCLYNSLADLVDRLRWALKRPPALRGARPKLREAVARFDWSRMAPEYDRHMEQIAKLAAR
jgi:glycosyltransferase involved in cell wall biosynthesis